MACNCLPPLLFPAGAPTGVGLDEVAWKDKNGEEVDCTICAHPMSADCPSNPWTGPGLFLTQACVNGHVYHKGCLRMHMNSSRNATCPECRGPILSEVADSLRRNGAPLPEPAPAPAPAPGGVQHRLGHLRLERRRRVVDRRDPFNARGRPGLFSGDGPGGGGGGGPFSDWMRTREERSAAEAVRSQEQRRLENERRRVGELLVQQGRRRSFGMADMTGVNGRFWLPGRAQDNPSAGDIMHGVHIENSTNGPNTGLWVYASNTILNPFDSTSWATLYTYEFNGLTDAQGDALIVRLTPPRGSDSTLWDRAAWYKQLFNLPTTPVAMDSDLPGWGDSLNGQLRPPAGLQLGPGEMDVWQTRVREERDRADEDSL